MRFHSFIWSQVSERLGMNSTMVLREVQLTGTAPEGRNQTQYELNSRPKSAPRQICLAVHVKTSTDQLRDQLHKLDRHAIYLHKIR